MFLGLPIDVPDHRHALMATKTELDSACWSAAGLRGITGTPIADELARPATPRRSPRWVPRRWLHRSRPAERDRWSAPTSRRRPGGRPAALTLALRRTAASTKH